ncbi:MAG: PDZ domain-containing protein [Fimbriimonadia bacterium]
MILVKLLSLTLLQATQSLLPALDKAVEVPMDFDGEAIFVKGSVNGKPATFFLDTGFSGALLLSDRINVGPKAGTQRMIDFVGSFEVPTVEVKSLLVGEMNLVAKEIEVPQWHVADIGRAYGRHCDGILGLQALSPYVVEFNFKDKKLVFHPRDKVDITKRTPDGASTFLVKMLPSGRDVINLEVGFGTLKKAMAFDTGNAFYVAGYKEDLIKAGRFSEHEDPRYMHKTMVASGATDSFDWWAHDFTIGGIPVQHAVWSIHDLPSADVTSGGTIGIRFIRDFNVTVDYRRRHLWFERISDGGFVPPPGEPGLRAYFDSDRGRWVVFTTKSDSPAAKAGIKEGDVILDVAGKDLRVATHKQFEDLLNGPPGSKVSIRISREGNLMRFELERAHLINGTGPSQPAESQ